MDPTWKIDRTQRSASVWLDHDLEISLHFRPDSNHIVIAVWLADQVLTAQSISLAKLLFGFGIGPKLLRKIIGY